MLNIYLTAKPPVERVVPTIDYSGKSGQCKSGEETLLNKFGEKYI